MNAIFWIFLALAFGFMLFVSLQPELPEGLSFLKNMGGAKSSLQAKTLQDGKYEIEGWHVVKQGTAIEFSKSLVPVNPQYKEVPPVFSILCVDGKFDSRLNVGLPVSAEGNNVSVVVGGMSRPVAWVLGQQTNVFPTQTFKLMEHLNKGYSEVQFQIPIAQYGPLNFKLDTKNIGIVKEYQNNCAKPQ